jgi:hypothetical protein
MTEPKVSNHYQIGTLLFTEGIPVSNKELRDLIKLYNKWEMPISERLVNILESPSAFVTFVKEIKK